MLLEISICRTEEEPNPSMSQLLEKQFVVGHTAGLKRHGNRSTAETPLSPGSHREAGVECREIGESKGTRYVREVSDTQLVLKRYTHEIDDVKGR